MLKSEIPLSTKRYKLNPFQPGLTRLKAGQRNTVVVALRLMLTASISIGLFGISSTALAADRIMSETPSNRLSFDIAAGPLSDVVNQFVRQAGVYLSANGQLVEGKKSKGLRGHYSIEEGFSRILSGTGLVVSKGEGGYYTLSIVSDEAQKEDDALQLRVLQVTASDLSGISKDVYDEAAAVSRIGREEIENYRGTRPADLLKSEAGVISGGSSTSGALDVNIRGLQGMGRVPVTVDGALNSTTTYQGYQGISNRSFVDPDFIADIAITQGPDTGVTGSGAIGGSVKMRTLRAEDLVEDDEHYAIRLKRFWGGNSSPYALGDTSIDFDRDMTGAAYQDNAESPDAFDLGGAKNTSLIVAAKNEIFSGLVGVSDRSRGNYHTGTNGSDAPRKSTCPDSFSGCDNYAGGYWTKGLSSYLPGSEVMNTSESSRSELLNFSFHPNEDHQLDIGYSRYRSNYGETYSIRAIETETAVEQSLLSHTDLQSVNARYEWNPDSDLIDFSANLWKTRLMDQSAWFQSQAWILPSPIPGVIPDMVLAEQMAATPKLTKTVGVDISNTSTFGLPVGDLSLNYGAAYLKESTDQQGVPVSVWELPSRRGSRDETSVFNNATWSANEWLTLNGGVRYQHYSLQSEGSNSSTYSYEGSEREGDAWGFHTGVMVHPNKQLQLFSNYKQAARLPSLMEGSTSFNTYNDPDLSEEIAHTWEFGGNYVLNDLWTADNQLAFKMVYFHNHVDGYIGRVWDPDEAPNRMYVFNMDSATFEGINASASFSQDGFSAELSLAYYIDVEYCQTSETCANSSVYGDYATNQIPPKLMATLTLNQALLEDKLNLGARINHTGKRSAGSGEVTGSGVSSFITPINWKPYTLVDLYGNYQLSENFSLGMRVENVADIYYIDALGSTEIPGPGRTLWAGVTIEF